jgi:hypothetical protein
MHVYAPGQDGYIPVSLTLHSDPAVTAQPARLPPAEKLFFKPLDETQLVYAQPFKITQDITVKTPQGSLPSLTLTAVLKYQACDESICYRPVDVPLSWTVPLRPR